MADEPSTTPQDAPSADAPQDPPAQDDALGDAGKKAIDAMKAERNQARNELRAMQKELEQLRASQMSESEKALAEAEARGKSAATTAFGQRLAAAQFVADAARRNPDFDAASVLEDLNLAKYVTDDGEPDTKGIAAVVERLVPERAPDGPRRFGNPDLGPRPPAPPVTDGSPRSLIAAGIAASDHQSAKR